MASMIGIYFHPYYLLNALTCTFYLWARRHFLLSGFDERYSRLKTSEELPAWELNMGATLMSLVMMKLFRYKSSTAYLADILFYFKVLISAALFMMDTRMFALFLLILYAVFLVQPAPWYSGPDQVQYFTAANFKETIQDCSDSTCWLIMFYTPWSQDCAFFSHNVAELSMKYTSDHLKFGKVDAAQWASVGLKYQVDGRSVNTPFPTFILFQSGQPVARLPHNPTATMANKTFFKKKDIIRVFELERRSKGSK